jgi:hypothetical protein
MYYNLICIFLYALLFARNFILIKSGCYSFLARVGSGKVRERERELQGKEEEIALKLERESSELKSLAGGLSSHEAALEVEQECLRKTREDLCNCELTISSQDGALTFREKELADKEKWLAETGLQELATTCKMVEEL